MAESQEAAISALKVLLSQRMASIKIVPLQLSSENLETSWLNLAGALQDNASFVEWSDRFWAMKQECIEDDGPLSVEESLRVM
jgi:hypothetical protein